MVRAGKAWAALVFDRNFSQSLRSRIDDGRDVEPHIVAASEVQVYQDISSRFNVSEKRNKYNIHNFTDENIGTFVKRDLYFGFQDFFQDFVESCDINRKFATIPVRVSFAINLTFVLLYHFTIVV